MDDDAPTKPPVRTDDDLRRRWVEVVGDERFEGRSLWLTWFDRDGRMLPTVVPIDELPPNPRGELLDGLGEVAGGVLAGHAPGGTVAMLISRPGPSAVGEDDRAWAHALRDLAARTGIGTRPLHLATPGTVRVLAADDLL